MRKTPTFLIPLALAFASACSSSPAPAELRVVFTHPSAGLSVGRVADFDFGVVQRGDTETLTLIVQNAGGQPLTLTGFDLVSGAAVRALPGVDQPAPVFSVTLDGTLELPAGTQREFPITFSPPLDALAGPAFEAVVLLRSTGPAPGLDTARLTLTGVGTDADPCALPERLDFGAVMRGETFRRSFTVTNPATSPVTLEVSAPESAQGAGIFSVPVDAPLGVVTLGRDEAREVTVAFQPTEARGYSAALPVRVGACPLQRVPLVGEGVDAVLSWAPATPDFGFATPGTTTELDVTFSNAGFQPVQLSNLGAFEGAAPSTVFTLPSGVTALTVPAATRSEEGTLLPGRATLRLRFSPTTLGPRSGTLRADTDLALQASVVVPLRGLGGGPDIDVSPAPELDLGRVAYFANASPPAAATGHLTIRNAGTRPQPPDPRGNLKLGVPGPDGQPKRPYWKSPRATPTPRWTSCAWASSTRCRSCAWASPRRRTTTRTSASRPAPRGWRCPCTSGPGASG